MRGRVLRVQQLSRVVSPRPGSSPARCIEPQPCSQNAPLPRYWQRVSARLFGAVWFHVLAAPSRAVVGTPATEATTTSGPPSSPAPVASRTSCPPPEIVLNGSLFQTDSTAAQQFGNVYEVRFMGLFGGAAKKRACKIKCVNGVWLGPLCAVESEAGDGGRFHSVLKPCPLRPMKPHLVVHHEGRPLTVTGLTQMAHESVLSFRCTQLGRYKFVGNATVRCLNGQWSAAMPSCLETSQQSNFSVQVPPTILYSVEKGDHGVSEEGELVVYSETNVYLYCLYQRFSGNPQWAWTSQRDYAKGWILSADEKQWRYELLIYKAKEHDSGTYTCTTPRGQTNEIHVRVRDVTCPPIEGYGDENRVTSDHGNQMHSKAKFACMEGYNLVGSEEVVCSPSGRWSDKAPHCVVIQCPTIPSASHLKMSTHNRTYGIRVHFSCPSNYRLLGPPFVTCWKNESWSDTPPTCEPIRCRSPLPPAHGRVLYGGRQYPGDSVHYTCNAGYVLIGESVSVCQANGTWSNNLPKCKPACEFPGQPAHARVLPSKFHYDIGELVTVACNVGFRLLGSAQLRCSRDGHWSHPLPHCRRLVLHK
ncbi:locomotion-related protein Hikaru genki-like isoform X1 [Dermacentor andersoni]|uniref:locomotion-related protein Hikaru genki-like isoform X1 n=1 Tax=Dermacentor andersoni TaxID=34620 RepID=UPI003B3B94C0